MAPTMTEVGQNMCNKWDKLVKNATEAPVIDFRVDMTSVTLDVIGRTAFGSDFQITQGKETRLGKTVQDILKTVDNVPRGSGFILNFAPFLRYIPFRIVKEVNQASRVIREEMTSVIASRLKEKGTVENERDLLGMLINSKEGKSELSPEEIMDEVVTFLFAGNDTTSTLLSWMFYEVSLHPEVEKKLHEEIDTVLQGKPPSVENISQLKYLANVINETLRLWPPVPLVGRKAVEDDVIHGYKIPKGTILAVGAAAVHHNQDIWKEPSLFNPERWNDESARPRSCIGRNFALQEGKLLAALFLSKFTFKRITTTPIEATHTVVLRPTDLKFEVYSR